MSLSLYLHNHLVGYLDPVETTGLRFGITPLHHKLVQVDKAFVDCSRVQHHALGFLK
jgi:hypothetical protein